MSLILIVDDDEALCRSLSLHLAMAGHEVKYAMSVGEGLAMRAMSMPDIILLDLNLPDEWGIEALPRFMEGDVPVIIMTAEPSNRAVVEAMQNGAFDYLRKPLDLDALLGVLKKVLMHLKHLAAVHESPPPKTMKETSQGREFVGAHPSLIKVHKQIGLLARTRDPVLIHGESGTGKELAARILHEAGNRGKPFVAINCSALVATLLESEFFGHEKGAFTGADTTKIGKFEFAAGGTVFLDEVGDMALDLQAKLLRVLQEEEFVRVGGLRTIPLAARIVAATHQDLEELVKEGRFRQDLYYRLSVSRINLPPLREHRSDILLLLQHFLRKIAAKQERQMLSVSPEVVTLLMAHNWPGNVRELENVLTRVVTMARGSVLSAEDFQGIFPLPGTGMAMDVSPLTLAHAEKDHILKILESTGWNISRTARVLDISPTTLRKKLADYRLQQDETGKHT